MKPKSRSGAESGLVLAVGSFPPPVHGMTWVTACVAAAFEQLAPVRRLDIAPGSFGRSASGLARRVVRVAAAVGSLVRHAARSPRWLYVPCEGGPGAALLLPILAVARLLRFGVVMHHHNYSYLETPRAITRRTIALAGPAAIHLALCETMKERLAASYGVKRVRVVSNAAWIEAPAAATSPPRPTRPITLGHIANLGFDKGLDLVLELAREIGRTGVAARVIVAGPTKTPEARAALDAALAESPSTLVYRGPVHGAAKAEFVHDLDLLVFPSRLAEAQPLVLLEALQAGVPVVAVRRGCIPGMVGAAGWLADAPEAVVERALAVVREWCDDPAAIARWRTLARRRFEQLAEEGERQWAEAVAALGLAVPAREPVGQP